MMEIDVVSESLDGSAVLLGEAKWGEASAGPLLAGLASAAEDLPFIRKRKVVTACWIGGRRRARDWREGISPEDVFNVLK